MIFKQLIFILFAILVFGARITNAQDAPLGLRDLADKSNFYVGAAVYTTHLNDPVHAEILATQFNMLTPENEAKACEVQPTLGRFNFTGFDRLVAFAEEHNMAIHGHTLLWHQCVPSWLENADFTREEAIGVLRDHIMTVVGRYKGRIPVWDVVNEGIDDASGNGIRETPWHQLIGDDYIELAFQFAHEADPDALLFYNDYGAEGMNSKSNAIYAMVQDFVARGIPIHGVGLQAHYTMGTVSMSSVAENIQRIGELGLQVQITEADFRYEGEATEDILEQQAGDYYKLLQTCLDSEYCTAFIVWGVSDKFTWLRNSNLGFYNNPTVKPLLYDDDYQPKPAYYAVYDALARKAGEEPVFSDETVAEMLGIRVVSEEVIIPEPSKSDPAQLSPDSVPGAVYYAPFPVSITLDGEIDDWANIPRVTIDNGTLVPADNDTAMTFAVAADAENLYFLAEVQDSNLKYGTHDPASEWYLEDSIEFYVNATGDLAASAYSPGIAQIAILAANITSPDAPIYGGTNSGSVGLKVVAVETETGYRIEASVPLVSDFWTIEPQHQAVIGFQAHLNGASGDTRDTKLIWSVYDTQDQSWSNPSLFGQLIFWDINQ